MESYWKKKKTKNWKRNPISQHYCNWYRGAKDLWYDISEDIEKVKDSLEVKEQKETTADKATDIENDNKLYEGINKDSRNLDIYQSICESSEAAQNASKEQQPNASDNLPSAEIKPCLGRGYGNAATRKPSTKVMQQRQAIKADILGAALWIAVVTCALKINVKAVVVVGIVGLAW